jgi:tRNA (mo5U34)-methyltransferase
VNNPLSAELRSRIEGYRWHHSIDLGDGIVTPGGKSLAVCKAEESLIFDRIDIRGKTILDIGAWNGVFSFSAKRRGAARVLATDSYCWSHPNIRGRETFELARSTLGLDIDSQLIDVSDLTTESVGTFDVVLYLGVFYHRYDTIEALAKVAPLARHLLVLETHLDLRDVPFPAMRFYPGKELANDPTNWWGPNEECVISLLMGHGFKEIEVTAHPEGDNRALFHAWRTPELRTRTLPKEQQLLPIADLNRLRFAKKHPMLAKLSPILKPIAKLIDRLP